MSGLLMGENSKSISLFTLVFIGYNVNKLRIAAKISGASTSASESRQGNSLLCILLLLPLSSNERQLPIPVTVMITYSERAPVLKCTAQSEIPEVTMK